MNPGDRPVPLPPWETAASHFTAEWPGPAERDRPLRAGLLRCAAGAGPLAEALLPAWSRPADDIPFLAALPAEAWATLAAAGLIEALGPGGAAGAAAPPGEAAAEPDAAAAPPGRSGAPIVAIIDDGIGFLNARFRHSPTATRFAAVWLMSNRRFGGQVLRRAEIDAWLAQGDRLDEAAVYRRLNADLHDPAAHRATEMSFSHGTHTLDLAAGAWPDTGDPVAEWPLLAVQLPPEAVDNTAGTQLEPLIVEALRWCLAQAAAMGGAAPLVVVVPLATFAGPKDGTKPVEALMAQMLDGWIAATGRQARVMLAWGNARLNRQAARLTPAPDAPAAIAWRLMPEDETASYLELRSPDAAGLSRLSLRITPPGAAAAQALPPLPPDTHAPLRDAQGRVVGRAYHVGPRPSAPGVVTPAHLVLAMAPTEETDPARPLAPHGAWGIGLAVGPGGPLPLRLEVQRDDSLLGSAPKGRQSWLDDPATPLAEVETAPWGDPLTGGPVTRAGTQSSFASAPSAAVITVAAARGIGEAPTPAPYSAEGAADLPPGGPRLAAVADRSAVRPGVLAAGTLTGSVRAGDGTSAATGLAARALAAAWNRDGTTPPGPAETLALVAHPAAAGEAPRLGAGTIG
jgi:hypothetical protein